MAISTKLYYALQHTWVEFNSLVKSLPGGWWKSKAKTKAGERYVLRLRVDPMEGEALAAAILK